MSDWISVDERLPESGDYSVIAYCAQARARADGFLGWQTGGMDMVHVQDYFDDITDGLDSEGKQLYTKWYLSQGVTHWHCMPEPPK